MKFTPPDFREGLSCQEDTQRIAQLLSRAGFSCYSRIEEVYLIRSPTPVLFSAYSVIFAL